MTLARKKKLTCPNCGVCIARDAYKTYCTSCHWNNQESETRAIRRDDYEYWFRVHRITFSPRGFDFRLRKQPRHILSRVIWFEYTQVPRWLQKHFSTAVMGRKTAPAKSRSEYHDMMKNGVVSSPQEYQAFYVDRRDAPYDDDEYEEPYPF